MREIINRLVRRSIFISSTCHDLGDLRSALVLILEHQGYKAKISEDSKRFNVPVNTNSYDALENEIRNCDYFVLILGGRRGGVIPDRNISIVEYEYELAKRHNKPIITFCKREVWTLLRNWLSNKLNPNLDEIKWPVEIIEQDNANYIFSFINRIRKAFEGSEKALDNWIHQFSTTPELREILLSQLAGDQVEIGGVTLDEQFVSEILSVMFPSAKVDSKAILIAARDSQIKSRLILCHALQSSFHKLGGIDTNSVIATIKAFADRSSIIVVTTPPIVVEPFEDRSSLSNTSKIKLISMEEAISKSIDESRSERAKRKMQESLELHRATSGTQVSPEFEKLVNEHIAATSSALWKSYVEDEISFQQGISTEKKAYFFCTDTAFDELNTDIWFREYYHQKLLSQTKHLAYKLNQGKRKKGTVIRLSILRNPRRFVGSEEIVLRRFVMEHLQAGAQIGLVHWNSIPQEFENLPVDFFLIPNRAMYRIFQRGNTIHTIHLADSPEGKKIIATYESLFAHLKDRAVMITESELRGDFGKLLEQLEINQL